MTWSGNSRHANHRIDTENDKCEELQATLRGTQIPQAIVRGNSLNFAEPEKMFD